MDGHEHGDEEASELIRETGRLDISATRTRHAGARYSALAGCPTEIHRLILDYLRPAQGRIQSYEPGSQASRSGNTGLLALRALCLVSRQMECVARPYLYETIVVFDPYNLEKLRETLDSNLDLGPLVKSLTVHHYIDCSDIEYQRLLNDGYDPGAVTLSQFSEALVAALERTFNLVMLSLNFHKPPLFGDPRPFRSLSRLLRTEIIRARRVSFPREFLPRVETLGIFLPVGGENTVQRSEEYNIFDGLLNCPALSNIVVRRTGLGPFPGKENYETLLEQRDEALSGTIRSLDMQVNRNMPWDDIRTIGSLFPALSSLKLSHLGHAPSRIWSAEEYLDRFQIQGLLDLSIDIDSLKEWYSCEWFSNSIKNQFYLAPNLRSLRIPLHLFRNHTDVPDLVLYHGEVPGPMLYPGEVLPRTLKNLVLIADMRVYLSEDLAGDDDAVAVEDERGYESSYPISCHLRYSWTVWFLHRLEQTAERCAPRLKMVTLEYKTNLLDNPDTDEISLNDPDADEVSDDSDAGEITWYNTDADEIPVNDHVAEINSMLRRSEGYFVSQLEALEQAFQGKGIGFSWTRW